MLSSTFLGEALSARSKAHTQLRGADARISQCNPYSFNRVSALPFESTASRIETHSSKARPLKQAGIRTGRRQLAGALLDVSGAAELLGVTEKVIRAQAARMLLPHRRWGGRLVFMRKELEEFFVSLPGCSKDTALENVEARRAMS